MSYRFTRYQPKYRESEMASLLLRKPRRRSLET